MRAIISIVSLFSLLINLLVPVLSSQIVYAQEATPSAEVSVTPTPDLTPTPEIIPEVTPEATPEATPTATIAPTITTESVASDWKDNEDGSWQTVEDVIVDKEYTAKQNDKIKIRFNKLPSPSGKIAVKEIKLSEEQIKQTRALTDTAYDITSTMQNGTFEYTLTLPTQKTESVEVKSSEDGADFVILGGVTAQSDTLTITGLNHFTIFVISGTITEPGPDTFVGTPFDETGSSIIINEFVYSSQYRI